MKRLTQNEILIRMKIFSFFFILHQKIFSQKNTKEVFKIYLSRSILAYTYIFLNEKNKNFSIFYYYYYYRLFYYYSIFYCYLLF